ncbi:hypothetical protein Vafri_20041 [Volvox africanus]|uniref:Uncharacterized protein n=1 Tax=Volvox africanus TaxID=51714 RepID=A0A8J4BPC9_9CHLO|nr:hypothetical protein Vafri_20041 [Volvox africanus]
MPLLHHVHRPCNSWAGVWAASYRARAHVPRRPLKFHWLLELSPYPGVSTTGLSSGHAQPETTRLDALALNIVDEQVSAVDWADGDVLQLQLADGRHVYAEVLAGPPSRTKVARLLSQSVGTPGTAPRSPQILCGGVRYIVHMGPTNATEGEAATAPPEAAGNIEPVMVLEAVGGNLSTRIVLSVRFRAHLFLHYISRLIPRRRSLPYQPSSPPPSQIGSPKGALSSSESLLGLIAVPPKKHAPALRSWAPLTVRLMKPTSPQQERHPQQQATYPGSLHGFSVLRANRVMTLRELRRRAAAEPGAWCDGSGPSNGPVSEYARAIFTAGEVAALMEGRRGVVLLQLHVGWEEHEKVPPYGPYKPLVLRLLREALERPDIMSYASSAPVPGAAAGNPTYGLTMILCADKEPFRSWGAHLASFGCQAALEAQSPYYKLLIGRILGYLPENISHYVQVGGWMGRWHVGWCVGVMHTRMGLQAASTPGVSSHVAPVESFQSDNRYTQAGHDRT